jgi:monoamine oxidase
VLVIGAGMAGLTAARGLARAGITVQVVEARERVGGRIHSVRDFAGAPVEGGAEFIHGEQALTWPEVRAAGLSVRRCPRLRHTMLADAGPARWLPRVLLRPALWPSFGLLRSMARVEPPDLSAREFLARRWLPKPARPLAELTVTGHLPGRPEEIGMLGLRDDGVLALESGRNHRVVEGYDRVPDAIAQGLEIRRGFVATGIRWEARRVVVRSVEGEELEARAAVSTLPVGVLRAGSVRFLPTLPPGKRDALERLVMGPVLKLLLLFRERFWPRRLALLACARGPVTLYWPVFHGDDAKPPVLTAYCTGPRAAALAKLDLEQVTARVLADLQRLFPRTSAHRQLVRQRRLDWASDPFARGGYSFVRPGGRGARERLAAPDTGALFWAGSDTQSEPIAASVEAAYASGLRAARQVRTHLERPATASR